MKILISSILDIKKSLHNRPHQIVKYLSKNHDITVISVNDYWKESQSIDGYFDYFNSEMNDVNFLYLTDKKISPYLQEVFFGRNFFKKIDVNDYDVHINYNSLILGNSLTNKLPTLFDISDDLIAMISNSPQIPSLLKPLGARIGSYFVSNNIVNSDQITCTTDGLVDTYDIDRSKCTIIPNGVNTSLFSFVPDSKELLGIDGFIIGYVGALREWVDLTPIYKALKKLDSNIKLLVVGAEGFYEENVNLVKKMSLEDRVIFTGMLPYNEIPLYISAMDVCLIPFRKNLISSNSLPLKLFEYLSCNKPVISSPIKGVKAVVNDSILYADSEEEYKENILKIYNGEHEIGSTRKGRDIVRNSFDWKILIEQMERILVKMNNED